MPSLIVTASSTLPDPLEASREASIDLKSKLNAIPADMLIVFATPAHLTAEAMSQVRRTLFPKRLVGASTPAIILSDRLLTRGIALMAFVGGLNWGTAGIESISVLPPREAGQSLSRDLMASMTSPQRNTCLYLYNGIRSNGSLFCAGMRDNLGVALPIAGAVPLDGPRLTTSPLIYQDRILHDGAIAMLVGGAHTVAMASRHSWHPLGKPRIIDHAEGNIIRSIDGHPAIQLYHDYFNAAGETVRNLQLEDIRLLYPLGIGTEQRKEYLVRNPIDILPDGSIVCQGDVPTGSRVHLLISNKDACRQSALDAAMDVREQLHGKTPLFVLVFESYARQRILGKGAAPALLAIRDVLGSSVPLMGLCTLGEVAPPRSTKNVAMTQVLNGSLLITAVA